MSSCQRMAKVPNATEKLLKITTAWVGCTIVTDDGRATAYSEREREFTFAKNEDKDKNLSVTAFKFNSATKHLAAGFSQTLWGKLIRKTSVQCYWHVNDTRRVDFLLHPLGMRSRVFCVTASTAIWRRASSSSLVVLTRKHIRAV